ncbi:MAG: ABC transporter ATP-binding protein, partial [Pyrobaculum sp.]
NLAAALLARPCAFLMDEPTSHLDWVNKKAFDDVLKRLGVPILFVTHDPVEALYVADRLCVMEEGRLRCLADMPPLDVSGLVGEVQNLLRLNR